MRIKNRVYINGGKLNGDLDADNWAILNYSVIPIGIICMWSDAEVPRKWSLCDETSGTPLLPDKPPLGGNSVSVKYIMYAG